MVFAHLNINSIKNKFELLAEQVKGRIDALMISDSKIDGDSTPYRLDRNSNGSEILLCIREDIPPYIIATEKETVESFYVEINLRKEKYLINWFYNPQNAMISNHLAALEKFLHLHSSKTIKVLILGDFNIGVKKQYMQSFCETYDLKSLQKQLTCYKNPNSPMCIDLFCRMFHVTFKALV